MQEGLRTTKEGVLHLGTDLSSESQFAAAATRSSISVMICPPLSLFVKERRTQAADNLNLP
jgi:hypothetical protein